MTIVPCVSCGSDTRCHDPIAARKGAHIRPVRPRYTSGTTITPQDPNTSAQREKEKPRPSVSRLMRTCSMIPSLSTEICASQIR